MRTLPCRFCVSHIHKFTNMKKFRRDLFLMCVIALALILGASHAIRQDYPQTKDAGKAIPDIGAEPAEGTASEAAHQKDVVVVAEENAAERYAATLFIEAPWGKGPGAVGLSNPSEQGTLDAGPNYGPQSFDVADDGQLYLLDSVNERVNVYDAGGEISEGLPGCLRRHGGSPGVTRPSRNCTFSVGAAGQSMFTTGKERWRRPISCRRNCLPRLWVLEDWRSTRTAM